MTKIVAIVAIVFAMAVPALAGDGAISGAELNAIGLSSFQPMSDAQATQVRGKGYAVYAWGSSHVNVLGSTSDHGYAASKTGNYGSHSASGADVSLVVLGAGGQVGRTGGFIIVGGVAGGGSVASVR